MAEFEEEHGSEDMALAGFDKINAAQVKDRIREIGNDKEATDELSVLKQWLELSARETALKKQFKEQEADLDKAAFEKYPKLTTDEIKTLVVEDKWLAAMQAAIAGEVERVSQALTARAHELALRYESPLPVLVEQVAALSAKVDAHLRKMGVAA